MPHSYLVNDHRASYIGAREEALRLSAERRLKEQERDSPTSNYVSSNYYYMSANTTVCPHTTTYLRSCPHATKYVSSYAYIRLSMCPYT